MFNSSVLRLYIRHLQCRRFNSDFGHSAYIISQVPLHKLKHYDMLTVVGVDSISERNIPDTKPTFSLYQLDFATKPDTKASNSLRTNSLVPVKFLSRFDLILLLTFTADLIQNTSFYCSRFGKCFRRHVGIMSFELLQPSVSLLHIIVVCKDLHCVTSELLKPKGIRQ